MAEKKTYESQILDLNSQSAAIDVEINQILNNFKFDRGYYLGANPDVARDRYYGPRPEEHYQRAGQSEGRLPNKIQQDIKNNVKIPEIEKLELKKQDINSKINEVKTEANIAGLSVSNLDEIKALTGQRNYATSDLASKLNFQVSDDQILNDYNTSKLSRLNSVVDRGNAQIAGIQERLNSAQELFNSLPTGSSQRKSSQGYIDQLNSDLSSVQGAVADATKQIKDFKPIPIGSPEAAGQITSFRSFLQLPEERASQQLYQIDPDAYRTSVALGQRYRQMAETPIGATTTPETEQLRQTIEDEAINQLRLGSTIGAEERRGYEQSIRGAQTARGNIFGLGPAVQEASQIGAAGEQRKLARYGAAQAFLGSGQTTGDALKADLAFRDALQQNRLGAASGFIAGGPSIGNLAQARTGQQQAAFQNYIQANQALPGGFNQQPSTAAPFYQAVDQNIPVALTQAFNDLYRSQANYLSDTYGAQTRAQASTYTSPSQAFGNVASGLGNLVKIPIPFCWVAREVYGIDNPKWLQFREWMLTKASDNLRNFYIEYGERIAESIRNKPRIKAIIREWMDGKIK